MPQEARRPADASLDSGRARRELGWEPRSLAEAIRDGRPAPD
jgi:nucleoside-diphosphate-sugar epimerase